MPPGTSTEPATFDQLAAVIRGRRTSMLVDKECEVPVAFVEQLCELASWAPNHKKTWPWRFALFTGDGRRRLGETMVADMVDADFGDEVKRSRPPSSTYARPATLVVGCGAHDNADAASGEPGRCGCRHPEPAARCDVDGSGHVLVDTRRSPGPRACSTCAASNPTTGSSGSSTSAGRSGCARRPNAHRSICRSSTADVLDR